MNNKVTANVLSIALVSFLALAIPARAADKASLDSQVNALEHRFFFHQYANDPIEKRLQRLELLVFGDTQAGSNPERLDRLKSTIAQRDKSSAERTRNTQAQAPTSTTVPNLPIGKYPALTTLEWRALKQTYPQDSLDKRLERLEVKLFGQASPAMAYADRVERLNRTLGVGVTSENSIPHNRLGPMPKATPYGREYSWQFSPNRIMPYNNDMSQSMNDMIRQMNQQMEQLMQMPFARIPNEPFDEPDTSPNKKLHPFTIPKTLPAPQVVPPYNDPNST